MAEVTFGLFDWLDRGNTPLQQLYEERLRLLEAAAAAGFFAYHLAEHHATPLGMASSPGLFLAAAAQRTRRIRLGPLVYLLPLYDLSGWKSPCRAATPIGTTSCRACSSICTCSSPSSAPASAAAATCSPGTSSCASSSRS